MLLDFEGKEGSEISPRSVHRRGRVSACSSSRTRDIDIHHAVMKAPLRVVITLSIRHDTPAIFLNFFRYTPKSHKISPGRSSKIYL